MVWARLVFLTACQALSHGYNPATISKSTAMTLEPGDLIYTGTPAGVGMARTPPLHLKPGDVVRIEIDGLGAIENRVEAGSAVTRIS